MQPLHHMEEINGEILCLTYVSGVFILAVTHADPFITLVAQSANKSHKHQHVFHGYGTEGIA